MSSTEGLAVGETIPKFVGPLVRPDGDTEEVRFETLLSDGPVLLCFYTNDFTPDCVGEWCSFRDYEWFQSSGAVQVVGVSKSRPYVHRKFIDILGLDFPLYADPDLSLAEAFEVKYRVFKIVPRSRRSCFLIDEDRTIRYRWIAEHSIDPTMATPPVEAVSAAVAEELGIEDGVVAGSAIDGDGSSTGADGDGLDGPTNGGAETQADGEGDPVGESGTRE